MLLIGAAASLCVRAVVVGVRSRTVRRGASILNELAEMRRRGVVELMPTHTIKTAEDLEKWLNDYEAWRVGVLKLLKANYPVNVYGEFEVIGSVPAMDWAGALNAQHSHKLTILDLRLKALQRIVDKMSK